MINTTSLLREVILMSLDRNVTMNSNTTTNQSMMASINQSITTESDSSSKFIIPTMPYPVSVLYLTMLCLAIGIGIPGNLITALAYFIIKNKSNCDWYIFFVAFFDLVSCLFRVTGYLMEFLGVWKTLTNTAYCIFVGWISQTSVCVSIFIFGLISIERYIKICGRSHLVITADHSRNICLVMASATLIMAIPTVFMFGNSATGSCTVLASVAENPWVKFYYCLIFALFIALMVAVIICYMAIAWTVRKRRKAVGVMLQPTVTNIMSQSRQQNDSKEMKVKCGHSVHKKADSPTIITTGIHEYLSSVPGFVFDYGRKQSALTHKLFTITGPQTRVILQKVNKEVSSSSTSHHDVEIEERENTKTNVEISGGQQTVNVVTQVQNAYTRRIRRDYKITGLLFVVTVIFILSWIPPSYATVKAFFIGYSIPLSTSEYVTLKMAPNAYVINNFSNPLVYLALSATYRHKVKHLFNTCRRFVKPPLACIK